MQRITKIERKQLLLHNENIVLWTFEILINYLAKRYSQKELIRFTYPLQEALKPVSTVFLLYCKIGAGWLPGFRIHQNLGSPVVNILNKNVYKCRSFLKPILLKDQI